MRPAARAALAVLSVLLLGAAPADPAPVAADPRAYADQWWVILSAKTEAGVVPEGLAQAAAAGVALRPARLPSTTFKGLMPCYEVVVAGASPDKAEALALLRALRAANVDAYVKNAGAWVGPRPELADHCATVGRPPVTPTGFWFADPVGIPLRELPDAVSAPMLASPGTLLPTPDHSTWEAPLPLRTVGAWNLGDTLRGVTEAGEATCTITGFARGVYGTPHWGTLQGDTPSTSPTCGQEVLYATNDCDAMVLLPGDSPAVVYSPDPTGAAPPWLDRLRRSVEDEVAPHRAAAKDDARERTVEVHETWQASRWRSPGGEVWTVRVELTAGEGQWWCGHEEYAQELTWVVGADGRPRWGPRPTLGESLVALVDVEADGRPELVLRDVITGSPHVLSPTIDAAEAWSYCDCPC